VASQFGRIDLLVNNAGRFESVPLEAITVEQWDRIFATNTRAPFLMAQAALPHLRRVQGRIVNIGSLGGQHAWATHGHYCTSKAALPANDRTALELIRDMTTRKTRPANVATPWPDRGVAPGPSPGA